ncbi:ABC transporter ATP-binding protein [Methylotetracoccus oryzae]|uniref:ABC transporter ATP-binding protein n=1 Tax=Methylotetracoccus oryzae TaxID=1919059 RepID=UPI00191467EC|nr:ABC transporter ATP-binding protein [Methylotetracoccus oryzae]
MRPDALAAAGSEPMIRLEGVSFAFREGPALHRVLGGIEGEVAPGEWVALLGQSGSGKSTLLHLVAGLDRPDEGAIWVGGTRVDTLNERERTLFRRLRVGFVYQSFNLLPTLTACENVALMAELAGHPSSRARRMALSLLADVGLADLGNRYPDRLSGGEQQRVAIARALIGDPWVLLADEPTGNLDSATGEQILDLLDRMLRQRGKTLLIATHSRELAERADRVWHLRDGLLESP